MSNNEKMLKPKYEAPVVVALGGLAQGAGASDCISGSSPTSGGCNDGSLAVSNCVNGPVQLIGGGCTTGTIHL